MKHRHNHAKRGGNPIADVVEKAVHGGRAAANMMPDHVLRRFAGNLLALPIMEQIIEQTCSEVASAHCLGSDTVKKALEDAGVEFVVIVDKREKSIKLVMKEKGGAHEA